MPGETRRHDLVIDLMRAGAAGLVMLFHLLPAAGLSTTGGHPAWFGWVGVQIFFVVSGYVIAQSAAHGGAGDFLVRRVLRLAPTAWICASITAFALLATAAVPATAVLWRWLLTMLFVPTSLPIDAVYWTLSVELAFYLLVAASLTLPGDRSRRIETIGFALGGASTVFWVATYLIADDPAAPFGGLALRLTLLPHGALFALGIMLRQLRVHGPTPLRRAATLLFLGGALLEINAVGTRLAAEWHVAGPIVAPHLVFLAGVAAIWAITRVEPWLDRWLPAAPMATIGLMTYPLYLLHQVVGLTVAVTLSGLHLPGPLAVAVTIGAMIGLAWLVTIRIEPPVRAALARGLNRFRGPARPIAHKFTGTVMPAE